jgi:branched-chain amino acid transport system substrate-binding protein
MRGTVRLAAAAVFLLPASCATPTQQPPGTSDSVAVAVAAAMTGRDAIFGEQMRRGAEMAVADINASGGLLGRKLRLEVGDDQCDSKRAIPVANSFVQKTVVFVAGHYCSAVSLPASAVYAENNILQISPATSNPRLTDEAKAKGWKTVLRTCGRDDIQGVIAGRYLVATYQGKKVAILHDETFYGRGIASQAKDTMNRLGLQEALYDSFQKGDRDYSALVSKMKQMGIDVVYVGSYHTETGLLMKQAREQGLGSQFLSEDALMTDEFWKVSGTAGEGLMMTFPPDPMQNPAAKIVIEEFNRQGYKPNGYTLYTYAAFQVYAAAVRAANSFDARSVAEQINGKAFDTVLGQLQYDDKGDVSNAAYVWYRWHDGRYAQIRL